MKKRLWLVHGELNMKGLCITTCPGETWGAISLATIEIANCFWSPFSNAGDIHLAYKEAAQKYAKGRQRILEDLRHGISLGTQKFLQKIKQPRHADFFAVAVRPADQPSDWREIWLDLFGGEVQGQRF